MMNIRIDIYALCILFLLALLGWIFLKVRRGLRNVRNVVMGRRPDLVRPIRNGRLPTLAESIQRIETLRPRETPVLVHLLKEVNGDLSHAESQRCDVEAHLMADVVDPVLHMLEALRPRDALPKDAVAALDAASLRIKSLRDDRRQARRAAASVEAQDLLKRLNP